MLAGGYVRKMCPHVLGYKDKHIKLLGFQYGGGSDSGLSSDGGWRCFFFNEILWAEFTDGTWHSSHDYIMKAETSFDSILLQARPLIDAPSVAEGSMLPTR